VQVVPSGYFVTISTNGVINSGNAVSGTLTSFSDVKTIGPGTVTGGISGNFVLASDGNIYFVTSSTLSGSSSVTTGISSSTFDAIIGNIGNGTVNGTAGNDVIYGGPYATNPTNTGNDTINAGAGDDFAFGGGGNDVLDGGSGADNLFGGIGNDSILGGTGDDTIGGGAGNDTIAGNAGLDYLFYADSDAAVSVELTAGVAIVSGGHAQGDSITGMDGVIGSSFNDTLIGFDSASTDPSDPFTNVFYGGGGDDSMIGRGGGDLLYGGTGNDTIYGDRPGDTFTGTDNDIISGGDGNDAIYGGGDADTITGDAGDDTVEGGSGNDSISGGTGNDSLSGGTGNDIVAGDAGNDIIAGDAGNDVLSGGDGNDTLYGGADSDVLNGDANDDVLYGGAGNDSLSGGTGNDQLVGDAGNDTLSGGDGNDTLTTGYGFDTVQGGVGNDTIIVANNSATPGFTIGGTIDGGTSETDTLDLTAWGFAGTNVIYDPTDPKAGTIQFLDGSGNVIGTMTFTDIERIITCFTPGSLATTDRGLVAVEDLRVGDRVLTRDSGFQPIVWTGKQVLSEVALLVEPRFRPVRILAGALGHGVPARDMRVSPQHRVLFSGPRADVLFGETEVLVPALHLVGRPGITVEGRGPVTYIHFMCASHQIVMVDGCWSESFQPGDQSLAGLADEARAELLSLFPGLAEDQIPSAYPAARPSLKRHESALLFAG
jgi:Ca2+-binding RTX toxin-like protein